jgi:uncharacterized membrane protein
MKNLIIPLIVLAILPALTLAQVQYYGIDVTLSDSGRSTVKMTITFQNITNNFNFTVFGKIENFNISSISEPVNCSVTAAGISFVNCQLKLTQDKRTIEIYYETNDFVKTSNNRNFFDNDFSINENITKLSVTIKLPEGTALVEDNIPNRLSFPQAATTLSDGRRIIVLWEMNNVPQTTELRFQVLYENVAQSLFLSAWPYIVAGIVIIAIAVYLVFKYSRRTEKLVLSVLDEYERKVVDIINNAGGEVNQKKIVQETNLSKAKVSRVIKSLVDRGVVEIERLGRTNKVKLLKKKFKI